MCHLLDWLEANQQLVSPAFILMKAYEISLRSTNPPAPTDASVLNPLQIWRFFYPFSDS